MGIVVTASSHTIVFHPISNVSRLYIAMSVCVITEASRINTYSSVFQFPPSHWIVMGMYSLPQVQCKAFMSQCVI
jgi:hypothetical protein